MLNIKVVIFSVLLLVTTTLSQNTTTNFENYSVESLPIIHLINQGTKLFDYEISVGQPKQTLNLRLDIFQGNVWLPGADYFTSCSSTSSQGASASSPPSTSKSASSTSAPSSVSNSASTPTSISNSNSTNDEDYTPSCASYGVYSIYDSIYAGFIDLSGRLIVSYNLASQFIFQYLDFAAVEGTWAVDQFYFELESSSELNEIEISGLPFIYANYSNIGVGGLALGNSEGTNETNNFLSNFVNNGIINSNSYSLALAKNNFSDPELILGGLKTNYFNGSLMLFDFITIYDPSQTYVTTNNGLTNIYPSLPVSGWGITSNRLSESIVFSSSYNDKLTTGTYPKPALLDSRYYYNYIPYSTLIELAVELNAYYSQDFEKWLVDCSIGHSGTIDIYLGDSSIKMPIHNFLYPASDSNGAALAFENGDSACFLAFLPDYLAGFSILGTPFLRNVYLAVDNENKQLAVAKFRDRSSSVLNDYNSTTTTYIDKNLGLINNKLVSTGSEIKPISYGAKTLTRSDIKQTSTKITKPTYYEIANGTIPFGSREGYYSNLTLTVPTSYVLSDSLDNATQIYISNGEILIQTEVDITGTKSLKIPVQTANSMSRSAEVTSVSRTSSYSAGVGSNRIGLLTSLLWSVLGLIPFI